VRSDAYADDERFPRAKREPPVTSDVQALKPRRSSKVRFVASLDKHPTDAFMASFPNCRDDVLGTSKDGGARSVEKVVASERAPAKKGVVLVFEMN
jgi:hypothetical protein